MSWRTRSGRWMGSRARAVSGAFGAWGVGVVVAFVVGVPGAAEAQSADAQAWMERCEADRPRVGGEARERFCEVRPHTLGAGQEIAIDAGSVGDIAIENEERVDIAVDVLVSAYAETEAEAAEIAAEVQVHVDGARVRVTGPERRRWTGWSVDFLVRAPRGTPFDLRTDVGDIALSGVDGRIRFETDVGDVELDGVAGDVRGRTRTGDVDVRLAGTAWRGAGLELETDVGDVTLHVPAGYSAGLDLGSDHGDLRSEVPIPVQGVVGPTITGRLGDGGPMLRVRTRVGDIRIRTAGVATR